MRTYKLYTSKSATTNAATSLNIIKNGRIRNVRWAASLNSVVDNDEAAVELSLQPVGQQTVNDSAGVIDQLDLINNGTSGGFNTANRSASGLDCPVGAGEKLYLNVYMVAGTPTISATAFIDVEE